jgi:ribosomal protein S18 acetylase RimI-like enzyme
MGVRRDLRRRGIGRRLIERTIICARERGLERIELEVFASNSPAIKLYEDVGFVLEGVKRRARKIDGAYDDLIVMALLG